MMDEAYSRQVTERQKQEDFQYQLDAIEKLPGIDVNIVYLIRALRQRFS